jgi:BirA family biotin operon repressor/biotin-[acetyl-CoA-carboxylase] ligase
VEASVRLKWPNDLLLDGGKVGGILVEAAGGDAVCGIGVNITPPLERHAASGPEDPVASIASPREAVWLAERKPDVSVVALVPDVLLECERRYDALGADPGALLAEWRARTVTLGQRVSIAGPTPVDGIAEDIAADGALLVRTAGGLRRVVVGDVVMGDVRR